MMKGPRSTDTTTTHARLLTRRCAGAPPRWRSIPSSGSRAAPLALSVHASTRHSLSDLIGARPHLYLMMCRHAPVQKINA